jgi:hypothetical protein
MERDQATRTPDPELKPRRRGRQSTGRDPGLNAPKKESLRVPNSPTNSEPDNTAPSGESRRPVTNQDEQNRIFNGDMNGNPLGENENEGE